MSTLNLFGDKNGGNSSNGASGIAAEPGVSPGVQLAPPIFWQISNNPITNRMADYVHHITTGTPIFFIIPPPLCFTTCSDYHLLLTQVSDPRYYILTTKNLHNQIYLNKNYD